MLFHFHVSVLWIKQQKDLIVSSGVNYNFATRDVCLLVLIFYMAYLRALIYVFLEVFKRHHCIKDLLPFFVCYLSSIINGESIRDIIQLTNKVRSILPQQTSESFKFHGRNSIAAKIQDLNFCFCLNIFMEMEARKFLGSAFPKYLRKI